METTTPTATAAAYVPEHLERWTSEDPAFGGSGNYAGDDLTAFYVAPISYGRDTSDAITLSNWRVIGAELEALARHDESGEHEFGHWAVGWYRLWLIHESDAAALQCADSWAASLSDYPVASEDDLSEQEAQDEFEAWDSYAGREWRLIVEKALQEYCPEDYAPYWADEVLETLPGDSDNFYSLWHDLTDNHCSWCLYHESDGPNFNFEDPAALLTTDVLATLTGLPLLAPEQQWRSEPYPWPGADPAPLVP